MEVVCKSDYQDIYRIKDGVLFIVNKFKNKRFDGKIHFIGMYSKNRPYFKNYKNGLRILTDDYHDSYYNETYKKGQVICHGYPVEIVNKDEWEYQIKTTGESFSGNKDNLITLLGSIENIIDQYNKRQ